MLKYFKFCICFKWIQRIFPFSEHIQFISKKFLENFLISHDLRLLKCISSPKYHEESLWNMIHQISGNTSEFTALWYTFLQYIHLTEIQVLIQYCTKAWKKRKSCNHTQILHADPFILHIYSRTCTSTESIVSPGNHIKINILNSTANKIEYRHLWNFYRGKKLYNPLFNFTQGTPWKHGVLFLIMIFPFIYKHLCCSPVLNYS